jgi:hypothetical protein
MMKLFRVGYLKIMAALNEYFGLPGKDWSISIKTIYLFIIQIHSRFYSNKSGYIRILPLISGYNPFCPKGLI